MPKNARRANQGGGAEGHGRDQRQGRQEGGQAGYNTSITHRETRAQDGKDHHGGGKRRSGAVVGERRPGRKGTGNLGVDAQVRGRKVSNERGSVGQHDDPTVPRVDREGRVAKAPNRVAAPRKRKGHTGRATMKGAGPAAKKKAPRPRSGDQPKL